MQVHYHKLQSWWGNSITIIIKGGVGMIKVSFENDNPEVAFLSSLSVLESHRGKGLAKHLMTLAKLAALKYNATKLQLDVEKDNSIVDWYYKLGFRCMGEDQYYYHLEKEIN